MRNTFSRLLMGLLFVLGTVSVNAQVTVTNPGNTTPGLAATYLSLAAAITDFNLQTAISGPVIITLDPGNPQTAPVGGYAIRALLAGASSTNTVTFNGSSNTITAGLQVAAGTAAAASFDAVFKIIGADWITIQNFTMQENAGNTVLTAGATNTMTEFGVLLVDTTATDGAQNNTIQNNIISLNAAYTNSVAIFSTSASSQGNFARDATSTAGTNSNNKIYGNTISNVAYGIYFICPPITATVFETGNDIGGTSGATGNTITFGNATASSGPWNRSQTTVQAGIYFRNGAGNNIRFNSVTSTSLAYVGSTGLNGIMISSGTAPTGVTYTSTISDNTVNITTTGIALATGIDFGHGLISTGTIIGSNNNVTVNQNATAAVSAAIIGIKANYAAASSTLNTNTVVINQNFTATATATNSSAVTAMTVPSGTTGTPTMNVLGNTITINRSTTVSATFTATMSGTQIGIQATGAATTMNIGAAGGGNANTVTIKEAAGGGAGTTSYTSTITFIDVNAAHATANVVNNTLNTTGSTIRSTGTLQCVNPNATVTALYNIKSNTATIDRVAASGTIAFTLQTTTPSNVADTVSNNNITFTGLTGTTIANGISQLGGPSAAGVKSICSNVISISGTNTGTTKGIAWGYSAGAKVSLNSVTITCAAPTVIGLDGTSTSAGGNGGISGNTISLTSSTTSPTSMIGITGGSTGPFQISNNTFTTLTFNGIITGAPVISGIALSVGTGNNINNSTINNITVGAATSTANPVIDGILISGGVSTNVFKNKIYGIVSNCTGATGVINGIRISGGGTTANNVYNNLIGELTASAATNTDAIRGISITSTSTTTTNNIYYNTIYLTGGGGTNFGGTGIFHTASTVSTTATLNLRNNIIVNNLTPNGTGLAVAFRRNLGTAGLLANYANTSNNNLFFTGVLGGSASQLIYNDVTSSAQTLSAYKAGVFTAGTIAPRDASSVTENPPFLSTTGSSSNFLHIDPSIATQVESGGSNIATFTDDYDGDVRNVTTPDIGADEGTFTLADLSGPSISYTALSNTSCTTDRTLSSTITDATGVNTTPGTKPRLYYKKSTDANTYAGNTSADNGWKYVEATNASSPFSFTTDYSLLTSAVVLGDSISYFIVAQDVVGTPNVSINSGTFTLAPTSVVLSAAQFPLTGTVNGYRIIAAGISGTVTIGAVAQTYTSITGTGGLFDVINTGGLSGNVTANIIDASVTETGAVALNAINYNGCASGPYTVTIKPNTTAILTGSVAAGSIIKLNGADYVTIDGSNSGSTDRSLTVRNTTTTTSGNAVIWLAAPALGNGATNNTVKNCIIEGDGALTTFLGMYVGGSTTISLTTAGSEANSNNTITNNLFRKTQNGLALFGYGAATPDQNNIISNNNFGTAVAGEGFSLAGINADRQQNLVVSGNEVQNITNATTASNVFGIRLLDFKNGLAYNNKVHDMSYTGTSTPKYYGIAVTNSTYTTAGNPSNGSIYNNIVYKINSTGTSAVWNTTGILASAGYGDKFYFNSVHLTGQLAASSSGLAAAFANGDGNISTVCTNIDVRNNIFSLTGSSSVAGGNFWAYYTAATTLAGSTINYNDEYCAGTNATNNVGRFNSVNYTSLATWQAGTGQEANSIAADPQYNSTTNLIPQLGSPVLGTGVNGTGITTDITGFTRGNPPTMGAYEQGLDAAAPVITYTPLGVTCVAGDRALNGVTITDASGVPTSGALQPRIYYKKGVGGTWFSSQGTLASGSGTNGTWNFTIVAADMGGLTAGDVVYYYVIAQDIAGIPNISANPGTGLVATDVNTVTTPPTTPNNYVVGSTLSGSYNVGTAQTYPTLSAAIAAYNTSCLGGAVTFLLTDAVYTEAAAMTINANPDASATNTLTIKPTLSTTNISVTSGSTTAIFILNGADYVTIDGSIGSTANTVCPVSTATRNLTITNSNAGASSAVVWLQTNGSDAATNNTIKNCNIVGSGNTQTLFGIGSGSSTISTASLGTSNNNNSIVNNNISKTQYGIYSHGASIGVKNTGTVINQNLINTAAPDNVQFNAIWVGFEDGTTISGNNISNLTTTNDLAAIAVGVSPTNISTTSSTGNEVTNALISNNVIGSVISTSATGFSAAGIIVASAASGTTRIQNNVITGVTAPSTSGDLAAGIYALGGAAATQIHFNSVSMSGTRGAASYSSYALAIGGTTPVLDIKDNALFNSQTSTGAGQSYAIGLAYTSTTGSYLNLTSMKNGLDTSGTSAVLAKVGSLSQGTGTNLGTLAAWTTETGADATSISADPMFNSSTNLRPQIGSPLVNAGVPAGGITNDILCVSRNITTPSIGAYEIGVDALAPSITYTLLATSCLTGDRLLNGVTIADVSGVPTSGALQPRVYFRKNLGTWFSSQGVLATGTGINGTWNFTISAATMGGLTGGDAIQYYVIAQDVAAIPNIGSNPSAGLVATDVNTVTTAPTTPNTDVVGSTLSGTYTVGTAGTYPTLTAAISAYNNGCLTGPVVFELLDASYSPLIESAGETFPMSINYNASASATNTLTIRPTLASTVITGNSATSIITFNGARYATIDGRIGSTGTTHDLTITNTNAAAPAIVFINDATRDSLRYTNLKSDNTTATSGVVLFSTTTGTTGNDNNGIDNCDIGPNAANPVNGIYSLGTTTSTAHNNSNNTISNNNVIDAFSATAVYNGIALSSGNTDWTISNNRIYQTAVRTVTTANTENGISISAGNGYTIANNVIGYASSSATGTMTLNSTVALRYIGINCAFTAGGTVNSIQNNTIASIAMTTSSGATTTNGILCGINVTSGDANIGTTTGNTIGSTSGTGSLTATSTTTGGLLVGINSSSTGTISIQNNIMGAWTCSGTTAGIAGSITGVNVSGVATAMTISGNTIGNTTADNMRGGTLALTTGASLVSGINFPSTPGGTVTVSNNIIRNLSSYGTGTGFVRGIWTTSGTGSTTVYSVTGNTINNLTTDGTLTTITNGQTCVGGIILGIGNNNVISQNTVHTLANINVTATGNFAAGIVNANATNSTITRNRIYNINNAGTSVTVTTPSIAAGIIIRSGTTAVAVTNNMISLGNAQTTNTAFLGIMCNHGSTPDPINNIYYNSINIEGTVTSGAQPSFGIARTDFSATARTATMNVKNNIITNSRSGGTGVHYAIANNYGAAAASATGWAVNASNNNTLNAAAGSVGWWTTAQTFAGWKSASAGDGVSVSGITVTYVSSATADLHLNMGVTPTQMESGGAIIAGLTNDYDNDVRPGPVGSVNGGALAPDMGADEFDGVVLDLFAPTITYSPSLNSNCTSIRTFAASATDNSGINITAGTKPRIYYKRSTDGNLWNDNTNGTDGWKYAEATNAVSPFTFNIDYSLLNGGTGVIVGTVVQYFVVAQDLAATPNVAINSGTFAATPTSVALTGAAFPIGGTINSYNIVAGLNTTLTIGGLGDYASLTGTGATGLFNAINTNGLTGNTTVNILDASVTETGAIALNQIQSGGCSLSSYTLLIKPDASVVSSTLTGALASGALVKILSSNVTIDGSKNGTTTRDLTITNTSTTSPTVILMGSTGTTPITNTTVKNSIVINGANTATAIVTSDGTTLGSAGYFNNITIQNNSIQQAYIGSYSIAVPQTGNGSGLLITGNDLNTSGANSIRLVGVYVQGVDGVTVSNNNIANIVNANAESPKGIWLATATNSGTVSGNNISTLSLTNTGAFALAGIYITPGATATGINVTGNTISTLSNSGTAAGFAGILTSSSPNVNITNNTISGLTQNGAIDYWGIVAAATTNSNISGNDVSGLTTATTGTSSGINVQGLSTGVNVFRNKISNIKNTNTGGYGSNGLALSSSSTTANIKAYNNVIWDIAAYGFVGGDVTDNGYGIIVTSGAGYNIDYNSVHMNTDQNIAGNPAAFNVMAAVTTAGAINLRNNVFANTQTATSGTDRFAVYCAAPNTVFGTINNNDYYATSGLIGFLGSNRATLANWQSATGQDANSLAVDPLFTTATNLNLLSTSTLIGAGVTVAGITKDYTNSTRNGTPSIGAYEDRIVFSAKIFLQGAYSGTSHRANTANWTTATNAGALSHPYGAAPYSYTGTETVPSGFFANTGATTDPMDWVLLELRDATTPTTVISRRAAIIREDGQIVDLDGVSPVSFRGIDSGIHFVVIRHRNHLGVRSGTTQLIDGNAATPTTYDFTTAQSQALQDGAITTNAAMAQVSTGVFGLWAGNVNQDIYVRATASAIPAIPSDAAAILVILGGVPTATGGYSPGDVNMDGRTRATASAIPAIPSDAAFILSTPLSGVPTATRREHKVIN